MKYKGGAAVTWRAETCMFEDMRREPIYDDEVLTEHAWNNQDGYNKKLKSEALSLHEKKYEL